MTTTTNGWDAICALDQSEVNDLLFQQHLAAKTGSPTAPFQFAATVNDSWWLANVIIAPPEMSFEAGNGNQQATFSTSVQSAMLMNLYGNAVQQVEPIILINAVWLPIAATPPPLQRTVDLQIVTGAADSLGDVAAIVSGTQSTTNWPSLTQAVDGCVLTAPMSYKLGTILTTNSGAGLEPTSFSFALQSSSDGSSSALLLLITTSGEPGSPAPLDRYPLQSGQTAALILSEEIMMREVLPDAVATVFNGGPIAPITPLQIAAQQNADGSWSASATAGAADFGWIQCRYNDTDLTTLNIPGGGAPPEGPPFAGDGSSFAFTNAGGLLQINWIASWNLLWVIPPNTWAYPPMQFTYTCASTPALDPTTDVVTFTGNESSTFGPAWTANPPPAAWLAPYFGPESVIIQTLPGETEQVFNSSFFPVINVASINTFALANLLFPGETTLTLEDLTFPGDLVLTGSMVPMLEVEPAMTTVLPGGTVTFTSPQDVWFSCPRWQGAVSKATQSPDGLYTAVYTAPNVSQPLPVTITVHDAHSDSTTSALVLVAPAAAGPSFTITPASVLVPQSGGGFTITATDGDGNPVDSTCVFNGTEGMATPVSTGVWSCEANVLLSPTVPFTIIATVTSNADPSDSGTVEITVGTLDVLTLTWGDGASSAAPYSIAPGASIQLSASVPPEYADLYWAIVPPGSGGTIVAVAGNPTTATLTAPETGSGLYMVCAYYADQPSARLGVATAVFEV